MEEVQSDFFLAGKLEIMYFVPESLLKGIELDKLMVDEFIRYIAMARYIQQKRQINLKLNP